MVVVIFSRDIISIEKERGGEMRREHGGRRKNDRMITAGAFNLINQSCLISLVQNISIFGGISTKLCF